MNRHSSIRDQYCRNKNCPYYGLKFDNKVSIHSRKENRFQCAHCKKTWVEHSDDIYFRLRAPRQKFELAKILYEAGKSVREIAHETGVSPGTVQRWCVLLGNYSMWCHLSGIKRNPGQGRKMEFYQVSRRFILHLIDIQHHGLVY